MPKSKNNFKRILGSRIFLFLVGLSLIVLIVNIGQESYKKHQLVKEINQLKTAIGKIEGNNKQLADLMDYLQKETYLEKEARVKLNLKKPGEKVVIIPGEEDKDLENSEQENSALNEVQTKNQIANYWKWWEYFFGQN